MMPEELQAIRERVSKATPGPWRREGGIDEHLRAVLALKEKVITIYPWAFQKTDDANMDFITHARSDVPALLAEVERLEAVVRYLTEKYQVEAQP